MEISNNKKPEYSWMKTHSKNIFHEIKVLFWGVVKNFKRISWHSKSDLTLEYIQVVGILLFMLIFCFMIFSLIAIL